MVRTILTLSPLILKVSLKGPVGDGENKIVSLDIICAYLEE